GTPEAAVAAVRAIRRGELLRIACADLLGLCDVRDVGEALSNLTDAVLHSTLAVAEAAVDDAPRLAIVGMGRLGGRETSYASDADVLFVYDADGAERADKAAAVVESMRRLLETPAAEPPVRIDAGLRPEGRQGPMARSLSAYSRYYERWSRPWETQALLRARPCAGDAETGARFAELADALRYPEGGLTPEQLVELRRVKARVDAERLPRGADPATHVKLGPGGLADVEWSAQLLQLCHGRDVPELRTTSTLDAVAAAGKAGLISPEDAACLARSWIAASHVRDALTLARGKPSDQLPRHGPELLGVLAVLHRDSSDPGEFVDEYLRQARRAHTVAERIFYDD
ncbi:MAG: bifunctional [glutamine synthetase] adenylyltransferase/[glutamine synthetase]-adenylyl-L-tyrosine phosphorylase, partial [Stackebrandtia sp.]